MPDPQQNLLDNLPTIESLADHRLRKAVEKNRARLAGFAEKLARALLTKRLESMPYALILVALTPDGPWLAANGIQSHMDWEDAMSALQDANLHGPKNVADIWRRRKENDAKREAEYQQRTEAYAAEHPFECGWQECYRRFKTEKGRVIHERHCRWGKEQNIYVTVNNKVQKWVPQRKDGADHA